MKKESNRRIQVQVKPNSKKPGIEITEDGVWIIKTKEPAIEGKANEGVIRMISEKLNIPKSKIQIVRGETSRTKLVEIEN